MQKEPKVSVVIPTYNRSEYVAQAVESVLQQSLQDFEIIIVDDGSTDETPATIKRLASRIRYISTPNQGVALARNVGMQNSRGRYIAYLDSDDLYYKFKLELQAELLDRHLEIGLVCTESSAFDDFGYSDEWHLRNFHHSAYGRGVTYENLFSRKQPICEASFFSKLTGEVPPEWLSRYIYFGNIFNAYLLNTVVFTPSIMFRRAVLETAGPQEPKFGLFHDLEFALRICKHYPVAFIDIPTYKVRYHGGQISTTKGKKGARNAIKKQRDLLQVLKVHGLRDKDYYRQHRLAVDRQLARLHRAVAIPLLSYSQGSPHQKKYYPRRARKYLQKCFTLGKPQCYLWILSFLPHFWRRLGFLALRMGQQSVKLFRRRLPHHDFS